ncbi:MAG: choice-of-anchor D domain-containing protein [Terriglobales bacterium]
MRELRAPWRVLVFVLILIFFAGISQAASNSPGKLVLSKSSMNFGTVVMGSATQVIERISSPSGSAVTIASASIEGVDFKISNTTFPVTVTGWRPVYLVITFTPSAIGNSSGSLVISLDGRTPYVTVPLYGAAVGQGQLAASPANINFSAGSASSQMITETLTNVGGTNVTLQRVTASGSGFSVQPPSLPLMLTPGQSATFAVYPSASLAANAGGSITIACSTGWWAPNRRGDYQNASYGPSQTSLVIPVSETAVVTGQLTPSPSTVNFGSVQVGTTQNSPATVTNSGAGPVTITQATAAGSGFSVSGLPLPMTLTPGESATFLASFAPQSAGAASGHISVVSNASNSTMTMPLSGSANAPGQLALSPASLNFGDVIVGKNQQLTASLTATGSSVTISSASLSGSEFTLGGIQFPVTIPAGQSTSFNVTFAPQAAGAASSSITFAGTASSVAESLSGAGTAPPQHSVALSWSADSSAVAGYNVYRGTQTGGPYGKLNSAPSATTTYGDTAVSSGQTYFYVTTAVDSSGAESTHSNEVQAVIPSP